MKFDIEWCAERQKSLKLVRDALDACQINTPIEWSYVRRAQSALTRIFSHLNMIEFIHGQKDTLGYSAWLDECHYFNNLIIKEFDLIGFYLHRLQQVDVSEVSAGVPVT